MRLEAGLGAGLPKRPDTPGVGLNAAGRVGRFGTAAGGGIGDCCPNKEKFEGEAAAGLLCSEGWANKFPDLGSVGEDAKRPWGLLVGPPGWIGSAADRNKPPDFGALLGG